LCVDLLCCSNGDTAHIACYVYMYICNAQQIYLCTSDVITGRVYKLGAHLVTSEPVNSPWSVVEAWLTGSGCCPTRNNNTRDHKRLLRISRDVCVLGYSRFPDPHHSDPAVSVRAVLWGRCGPPGTPARTSPVVCGYDRFTRPRQGGAGGPQE
jgi:hypothetical protein